MKKELVFLALLLLFPLAFAQNPPSYECYQLSPDATVKYSFGEDDFVTGYPRKDYEVLVKTRREGAIDSCAYATHAVGADIIVTYFQNESAARGAILPKTNPYRQVIAGPNWYYTSGLQSRVKSYQGNTPIFEYTVYNPTARFEDTVGNCLVSVSLMVDTAPGFGNPFYDYDEIPNKGPHQSKEAAQAAERDYVMKDIVERGNKVLTTPSLVEFCRPSASPSPSPTETPSPSPLPSPSPSPSPEPKCQTRGEILFEPTQGVWQDDYSFADRPGARIVKTGEGEYHAELPMVQGRRTLIFGQRGAGATEFYNDRSRGFVTVIGTTTGTMPVGAKLKFTVKQGDRTDPVYETGNEEIYVGAPCGPERNFTHTFSAGGGLPPDKDFKFHAKMPYALSAELVRADDETAVKTTIYGEVVQTTPPKVHFVPTTLLPTIGVFATKELANATKQLAEAVHEFVPDFFPYNQVDITMKTTSYPVMRSYASTIKQADAGKQSFWHSWFVDEEYSEQVRNSYRAEGVAAAVLDEITASAVLAKADKIVLVMPMAEAGIIFPSSNAIALSVSQKVVVVPYDANLPIPRFKSVAHELAHSMPFIWSSEQMQEKCNLDYHNTNLTVAHGFRITYGGQPAVRQHVPAGGAYAIMGTGFLVDSPADRTLGEITYSPRDYTVWITQCTYAHLLEYSQNPVDPKMFLVRGQIARGKDKHFGRLLPAYEIDGFPSLSQNGSGRWKIVLRSAAGAEIAAYPFQPQWALPTHPAPIERNIISFSHSIPFEKEASSIELHSPDGLEATLQASSSAPQVSVLSPANYSSVEAGEEGVEVSWKASDADGDALLYTMLYSSDGGENWRQEVFETSAQSASVRLDDAAEHLVKVIATDGVRSSEAVVSFNTRAQPQATKEPASTPLPKKELQLPETLDLSFLPSSLAGAIGSGVVKLELHQRGGISAFYYQLHSGVAVRVQGEPQGEVILTISATRSVLDAIRNSVDSQNALKLAVAKDALRVQASDSAKQAALGILKQTVSGVEFNPPAGSELNFRGKKAVVVETPGRLPALRVEGSSLLAVMNQYGSQMGAMPQGVAQAIAQARQADASAGVSAQFTQRAGILAVEQDGELLVRVETAQAVAAEQAGNRPARIAYNAALAAKMALENALKKVSG